ncbi:MAG TPA: PPC domain-containing protein [Chthonomonadaceae bacterium]|nr:PPC domain-containing protein [Chthonomonadaceae bacterium]
MVREICKVRGYCILTALALLALLPGPGWAQGGQGGGFGGGRGGGGLPEVREGDIATYKHILTPGDRGEWPLTIKAGETVIVFVTSDTFDPAAEIVDAAGKVLAQNDDVHPGDQDSLILYRFPAAGQYKILVKGFKSVAGGQYSLTLRRFLPTDLRRGERNATVLGRNHLQWHRFSATAGETLVVTGRSAIFNPNMEIYAPNGEQITADRRSLNGGRTESSVFRAETKGDYYLRIASGNNTGGYAVTVAAARVAPIAIGAVSPNRHLDAGGLDLWTFNGTAGDLLHVQARAGSTGVSVAIKYLPPAAKEGAPADAAPAGEDLVRLPSDPKGRGELIALLRSAGSYQVEVSQPLGLEAEYTLSVERDVKPWAAGADLNSKLVLGGSDYWAIEGKAGQVVRLAGLAEPFDITLELYNPRGERIEANDDGDGGRNALLTALLKETGRYLLRVSAFGDGGSGPYRLVRRPDPTRPIQIGARVEENLGTGSSDIWSFRGKAGQAVILSVRSQDFGSRVTVFGPDAIEVASDESGREGDNCLFSIRLPLDGVYTIWVSAPSAGGKYVIHLVDAD